MDYQEILDNIRLLADDKPPVEDISELLYNHGCHFLLAKMPESPYAEAVKRDLTLNEICIKERYKTCKPVFNAFESNNIRYTVIKGAVLSQVVFGDILYRISGDIDLLISRCDIDKVKEIMLSEGFIQGRVNDNGIEPYSRRELLFHAAMSHQAAPFIKKTGNPICPYVNVDINMDIMWGESKEKADMDFVLEHTEVTTMCGVKFQKLSPEMEFTSLCLHHYKDMNSIYLLYEGSLKLSLFCDIYYYLKRTAPDISGLKEICRCLHVPDYVYYCIYYTNFIFGDRAMEPFLTTLRTETSDSKMNTFGLTEDEIRNWEISFPEMLFGDLRSYFDTHLTAKDWDKIMLNRDMML
jgi:hypothetical protein